MKLFAITAALLAGSQAFAGTCPTYDFDLGGAVGNGLASGDTTGMGNDDTKTCASGDGEDVSFLWTAPYAGTFEFSLQGSTYDTALQIKDFGSCADLFCNDDYYGLQSAISYQVNAGDQLYLSVDGYNGATGVFTVNINEDFALVASGGAGSVDLGVSGAPAGATVYFLGSVSTGYTCHPSGIVCVNLNRPRVLGSAVANAGGHATLHLAPPALPPTVYLQAAWVDAAAGTGDVTPLESL